MEVIADSVRVYFTKIDTHMNDLLYYCIFYYCKAHNIISLVFAVHALQQTTGYAASLASCQLRNKAEQAGLTNLTITKSLVPSKRLSGLYVTVVVS